MLFNCTGSVWVLLIYMEWCCKHRACLSVWRPLRNIVLLHCVVKMKVLLNLLLMAAVMCEPLKPVKATRKT